MDTLDPAAFYRALASWPASEAEASVAANLAAALVGARFVAIHAFDAETGLEILGQNRGSRAEPEALKVFLRQQSARLPEDRALELEPPFGPLESSASRFRLHGIASSARDGRSPHLFGSVAFGFDRAPSEQESTLQLVAAQRLAHLAESARHERLLGLRSQFLSIASHELKTPLTAIYGILQLQERMLRLKRQEAEVLQPEKQHAYLKMVIRQVERLNELIDGLLDVSRIQNGRFMVEPSDCDAVLVLGESVTSRLNVIASEASVSIHLESPGQLKAWVDPVRFEEVVTNLIMNAIRFSPEGGIVRVKLREEPAGFRLIVKDQGPTVAHEDRERLFQPFERAQRTSRLGGLGLGLFISRQIAQLHNGSVTLLESGSGCIGNTVEAFFPARVPIQAVSA